MFCVNWLLAFVFLLLVNCQSKTTKAAASLTPPENADSSDLTWREAQVRKARVSNPQYKLKIVLDEKAEIFSGESDVRFNLNDVAEPLRLDFYAGQVQSMVINGTPLSAEHKKKYWIELPAASLHMGQNDVKIAYTHETYHESQGLQRFIDPETHQVFVYTQFETFDARRFMPCFDQPDLRAILTLSVEAPANWSVISATRETDVQKLDAKRKLWNFPVTPPLATYLFSLHAGPFKVWTDQYEDIPLRLFARPSMAKYVPYKEWLQLTKQGLKYYNSYFNFRYPFKKLDQLIVPEFDGAMENVAAITYSEDLVPRGSASRHQRRRYALDILHEMAHQWFGDTVTMKWWNNLWLNESFATFMSTMALHEGTAYKESWQDFYEWDKDWAYWQDGLGTTHPIEAPIESVKDAFANFDGVTYGKGAAALKELWTYIGPQNFQAALREYIPEYAYKNADLEELITKLQAHSQNDLHQWATRWLRQTGYDTLSARWTCEGGRLKGVEVTSTAAPANFRPQAFKLALFSEKSEPAVLDVKLKQSPQVVSGDWACPVFVYPNYDDDTYARVQLDPVSLEYAKSHLGSLKDAYLRTMVWNDLWQMVRSAKLPLKDYVALVQANLHNETDELLLEQLLRTINGLGVEESTILTYWPHFNIHGTVLSFWPQDNEDQRQALSNFVTFMQNESLRRMQAGTPGSDSQKFWYDNVASFARTPAELTRLYQWARAGKVAAGLSLDLERRWNVVLQLSRFAHPQAAAFLKAMKKADATERGEKFALAAEAIQPDREKQKKIFAQVAIAQPTWPMPVAKVVLAAIFPLEQAILRASFADDYYLYLQKNGAGEDDSFVDLISGELSPLTCEPKENARMHTFLNRRIEYSPNVSKTLRNLLEEDDRCLKTRAVSGL